MTPDEFEKEIAKIEYALKGRDAKITWDSKFPDPDNPKQLRQVDILIEENENKTIVECRHHKAKQDVKWIEEIYGRKVSLNAFSAIAVSSSGFTEGAVKKAKRFGIVLRTLNDISLDELSSWGTRFRFEITYVKFNSFTVCPILPTIIPLFEIGGSTDILRSDGKPFGLSELYYSIASAINETGELSDGFAVYLDCQGLSCGGSSLVELIVFGDFQRVVKKVWLPCVHKYLSPSHEDQLTVIKNETPFNSTAVYQTKESIFQVIDISMAQPIKQGIFRSITCIFEEKVKMSGMAIIGLDNPGLAHMPLKIKPIRNNSSQHIEIQSHCIGMTKYKPNR